MMQMEYVHLSIPRQKFCHQDKGFELPLIGSRCSELHITDCNWSDLTEHRGVIRREVRTPNFIMDAVISGIWENGTCQGAAIIFRDKTVVHQMEDEIAYRVALSMRYITGSRIIFRRLSV